jgi:hypothetical protein
MDEQVRLAMARWPDVPAVYGWLRLDRRGTWLLIDRGKPGFDEAIDGAGSPITNPRIVDFIARNYLHDEQGRWYWQNGPQQVFVDLDLAPLILRVLGSGPDARLVAHTGEPVSRVDAAWRTAKGELLLSTDLGPGAVHDMDLGSLQIDTVDGQDDEPVRLTLQGRVLVIDPPQSAPPACFERRPRPAK